MSRGLRRFRTEHAPNPRYTSVLASSIRWLVNDPEEDPAYPCMTLHDPAWSCRVGNKRSVGS